MKGGSGQVQTVSIIDTISELASNQGDRAKITQVAKLSARPRPSPASHAAASAASGSLSLSSSSPASGPRAAVSSSFLATNINISQMSLPPTPGPAPPLAPPPAGCTAAGWAWRGPPPWRSSRAASGGAPVS